MSFKKTRIYLNDLNDLNGKPRGKLPGLLVHHFLNGTKYLNGMKGFKWHVPFKYSVPFKYMREYLNDMKY